MKIGELRSKVIRQVTCKHCGKTFENNLKNFYKGEYINFDGLSRCRTCVKKITKENTVTKAMIKRELLSKYAVLTNDEVKVILQLSSANYASDVMKSYGYRSANQLLSGEAGFPIERPQYWWSDHVKEISEQRMDEAEQFGNFGKKRGPVARRASKQVRIDYDVWLKMRSISELFEVHTGSLMSVLMLLFIDDFQDNNDEIRPPKNPKDNFYAEDVDQQWGKLSALRDYVTIDTQGLTPMALKIKVSSDLRELQKGNKNG